MQRLWIVGCAVVVGACIKIPEYRGPADADSDGDTGVDAPGVSCSQAIDLAGLLVYLPLDSIVANRVEDASPNNHDGMVLGGAMLGPGRHGNGVVLDGGGKAIDLGSPAAFDNLDNVTVCAWINLSMIDAANAGATIADKSNDGYTGGWNAYLDYDSTDTAMHVGYLAREGVWSYGESHVATSTWTHACTVWSLGSLTVYVDGRADRIQQMGTTHPLPAHDDSSNSVVLGRQTNTNQFYLYGTLDDFVMYNRALSATEIASIHACSP